MGTDTRTDATGFRITGDDWDVKNRSVYISGGVVNMQYRGNKDSLYESLRVTFPDGVCFLVESRDSEVELSTGNCRPLQDYSEFVDRIRRLGPDVLSKIDMGVSRDIQGLLGLVLTSQKGRADSAS